ncbi:MAG TPA: hypothetical protein VF868_09290 [Bacteroidia bacterium]|jgi:hypothetical protein
MKRKIKILDKIAILIFLALTTGSVLAIGIRPNLAESIRRTMNKETDAQEFSLISFKGRSLQGKTYINWTVTCPNANYFFILERSVNGQDFTPVDLKKGAVSPAGKTLVYSYIDNEAANAETSVYRLCLHEIQAFDADHNKAILSKTNLFSNLSKALITIN